MSIPTIAESKRKIREMGWEVWESVTLTAVEASPIADDANIYLTAWFDYDAKRQAYADLAAFLQKYCNTQEAYNRGREGGMRAANDYYGCGMDK